MNVPVFTIDGPGGAGKGTVSGLLARELGWHYLDSGALYRLLALVALRRGVAVDDEEALVSLAGAMDIEFEPEGVIRLDGEDVSSAIRQEEVGNAASHVAASDAVRQALLQKQRDFRRAPGLVADGRDMGTVVFPDAGNKVFLTASAEERARRRYKQLMDKGIDVNLADLLTDIRERDERDSNRAVSPLRPAADAVQIDTTSLSIDQVVQKLLDLLHR